MKKHTRALVQILNGPADMCGGKRRYDKKGAVTAKNSRYHHDHVKLRVYECPDCGGWHLTKLKEFIELQTLNDRSPHGILKGLWIYHHKLKLNTSNSPKDMPLKHSRLSQEGTSSLNVEILSSYTQRKLERSTLSEKKVAYQKDSTHGMLKHASNATGGAGCLISI